MNEATATVYKTDKRGNWSHRQEVLGVWDEKILFTLQTPVPDVANKHAGWTAKEADGSERTDRIWQAVTSDGDLLISPRCQERHEFPNINTVSKDLACVTKAWKTLSAEGKFKKTRAAWKAKRISQLSWPLTQLLHFFNQSLSCILMLHFPPTWCQ